MDDAAFLVYVESFLSEEYPWAKWEDSVYHEEIYTNYNDVMSDQAAAEILQADDPWLAFDEKLYEWYDDEQYRLLQEQVDKLKNKLTAPDGPYPYKNGLSDEQEERLREIMEERLSFDLPVDHYLKQSFYVNVMLDTGDGNYDYSLNAHFPCYYGGRRGSALDKKASIVWLAKQQGYSKGQLRRALDKGDMGEPKGFLESMRVELANVPSHMQTFTFLVEMDLEQLLLLNALIKQQDRNGVFYDARKKPYCGYIVIGKEAECGLYDPWGGGGSVLEVQLEKDVRLPVKYIRSALPDGGDGCYSIDQVYGLCRSVWKKGRVKEIHVPQILKEIV